MDVNTDKIRLAAAQQGKKLGELAIIAGVSRQTLSTTMSRKSCRAETAVRIAKALGVPVEDIIIRET